MGSVKLMPLLLPTPVIKRLFNQTLSVPVFRALLNHQPMGYYPLHVIANEARRRGIKLLPADVNQSQIDCKADSPASIRIGLKLIKGISRSTLESICQSRNWVSFLQWPILLKELLLPGMRPKT